MHFLAEESGYNLKTIIVFKDLSFMQSFFLRIYHIYFIIRIFYVLTRFTFSGWLEYLSQRIRNRRICTKSTMQKSLSWQGHNGCKSEIKNHIQHKYLVLTSFCVIFFNTTTDSKHKSKSVFPNVLLARRKMSNRMQ